MARKEIRFYPPGVPQSGQETDQLREEAIKAARMAYEVAKSGIVGHLLRYAQILLRATHRHERLDMGLPLRPDTDLQSLDPPF